MPRKTSPKLPPNTASRARVRFILVTILLSALLLADMIFIFCMSAESMEDSGNRSAGVTEAVVHILYPDIDERPVAEQTALRESTHHAVRELAHITEFGALGLLAAALLLHLSRRARGLRPWMLWALPVSFGLLYAASDEWHQTFTGRGASVKDVGIDLSGVLAGVVAAHLVSHVAACLARRKRTPKPPKKTKDRPEGAAA